MYASLSLLVYLLLTLITQTALSCSLDKISLDAVDLTNLNTIITSSLQKSESWPNETLYNEFHLLQHKLTIMPLDYNNLFSQAIQRNANLLLERVCDDKIFENNYYQALADQSESSWQTFSHNYNHACCNALKDKLPFMSNAHPQSFLVGHLSDSNLKKKSSSWVLPGLLVMIFGQKIERLSRKPLLTNK